MMKINKITIMAFSYFVGSAFTMYGTYLMVMHLLNTTELLQVGLLVSLVFTVFGIMEIFNSKRLNVFERGLWFMGFLFLNVITGFLYLTKARRRIIAT